MKRVKTTYNYKLIIVSAIIVILLAILFFFKLDTTKIVIRNVLEARLIYFLFWIVPLLIFLTHYFIQKDKMITSETIITRKFGAFMDNALGGASYGTIITTSLTLLKGLYIQNFFTDKKYFLEFNNLDLVAVFGVVAFLLYYALMKVVNMAKETYKVQNTEQVLTENKIIVVPNDVNKLK
jgi:hypothetical protein